MCKFLRSISTNGPRGTKERLLIRPNFSRTATCDPEIHLESVCEPPNKWPKINGCVFFTLGSRELWALTDNCFFEKDLVTWAIEQLEFLRCFFCTPSEMRNDDAIFDYYVRKEKTLYKFNRSSAKPRAWLGYIFKILSLKIGDSSTLVREHKWLPFIQTVVKLWLETGQVWWEMTFLNTSQVYLRWFI